VRADERQRPGRSGVTQQNEGQLRVIAAGADTCRPSEVAIAWNANGVAGEQAVAPEPAGANCPLGGARLTAANGVAYVCSSVQGEPPDPGLDG